MTVNDETEAIEWNEWINWLVKLVAYYRMSTRD